MTTAKLLLLALTAVVASAQQNSGFRAPWVSCFDLTGQFVGAKDVRTDAVRSSDGKLRTYAEISAIATGRLVCENTVRLFISLNDLPYSLVFAQPPSVKSGTANSLGPVAWSADDRWLAVEFGFWFYASDYGSLGLLLYDSRTRKTSTPDVLKQVERTLGMHCSLDLRSVAGFDSRSRVVLRVADWRDDEGHASNCIQGVADWLYDPVAGRAVPRTAPR